MLLQDKLRFLDTHSHFVAVMPKESAQRLFYVLRKALPHYKFSPDENIMDLSNPTVGNDMFIAYCADHDAVQPG